MQTFFPSRKAISVVQDSSFNEEMPSSSKALLPLSSTVWFSTAWCTFLVFPLSKKYQWDQTTLPRCTYFGHPFVGVLSGPKVSQEKGATHTAVR